MIWSSATINPNFNSPARNEQARQEVENKIFKFNTNFWLISRSRWERLCGKSVELNFWNVEKYSNVEKQNADKNHIQLWLINEFKHNWLGLWIQQENNNDNNTKNKVRACWLRISQITSIKFKRCFNHERNEYDKVKLCKLFFSVLS